MNAGFLFSPIIYKSLVDRSLPLGKEISSEIVELERIAGIKTQHKLVRYENGEVLYAAYLHLFVDPKQVYQST